VSRQSVEAALRLRERLGFRGAGERGIYRCHPFCEIGATPLATALDQIPGQPARRVPRAPASPLLSGQESFVPFAQPVRVESDL
jgi:hypothetical protein